jgi:hypothetical protein
VTVYLTNARHISGWKISVQRKLGEVGRIG